MKWEECQQRNVNSRREWGGTRCCAAAQVGLSELFEAEGFRCDSLLVHEKTVQNRALGLAMDRRWIQVRALPVPVCNLLRPLNFAGRLFGSPLSILLIARSVPRSVCGHSSDSR